jgi:hypothetical protein
MKLLNMLIKIAQVYVVIKICIILYLIKSDPRHHTIDEVLWWVSVLILDMWVNLIVFNTDTVNVTIGEPDKEEE